MTMEKNHTERDQNACETIGVLLQACDGELGIGLEALRSVINAFGTDGLFIQIIDDASTKQVGEQLAEYCIARGVQADCHRMDQPLGYRGIMVRALLGMRKLAERTPSLDYLVKLDTDTLVIDPNFGTFVKQRCRDTGGLWAVTQTLRNRDLLLLIADLFPFGFRRKRVGSLIHRKWQLSRLLPVWWTDIGFKALRTRQRINEIATGGIYIIAGPLLQRFKQQGYLDRDVSKRYGFVTSEEDTMVTLMTRACGGRVIELNTLKPNMGITRIAPQATAQELVDASYMVVHPLKSNERGNQLRGEIMAILNPDEAQAVSIT